MRCLSNRWNWSTKVSSNDVEGREHEYYAFQTEIEFELPKGCGRAGRGTGTVRCASLRPPTRSRRCADPRVQQNEAYLAVIVLARRHQLGSLTEVHTGVIENLYASDRLPAATV